MNLVNSKTLIQSNFILNLNNYHKNFNLEKNRCKKGVLGYK